MVEAVNLLAHFNTWVQPLDVRKMRKEVDMTQNNTIPDAELAELRRLHAAANVGTLEIEDTTAYSLDGGVNDVWFGVNVKGNHQKHAERRVATAQSIAALHNAFPGILARLEAAERERDELRDRCELYRLAATAMEPEPLTYTTGGTWETRIRARIVVSV